MDADIGEHRRLAGARRIRAPLRLLLALGIDRQRQPVLHIGGMDGDDLAEFAGRHHLARLPHHGVAGVVERDDELPPERPRERHQRLGFGRASSTAACRR